MSRAQRRITLYANHQESFKLKKKKNRKKYSMNVNDVTAMLELSDILF